MTLSTRPITFQAAAGGAGGSWHLLLQGLARLVEEGAHRAVKGPVPTVAMATSLGFHAGVSADAVYAITAAICDRVERVRAIHEAAASFDPARAATDPGGPLHAGATRYFRERGILA